MQVKKVEELPQTSSNLETETESSEESEIEILAVGGTFNFSGGMQFLPCLILYFIYLQLLSPFQVSAKRLLNFNCTSFSDLFCVLLYIF